MSRGKNPPPPFLQSPGNRRNPVWLAHRERTPEARATWQRGVRFRRIRSKLIKDQGGDPSEAQVILCTHAAGLSVWAEEQLPKLIDQQMDLATVAQLRSAIETLRRLLMSLGLDRQARDVTPSLSEYLKRPPTINGDATSVEQ